MTKTPNLRDCFKIKYIHSSLKLCIKISKCCLEIVMSSLSYCMAVLYLQSLIIRDLSSIQCTAAQTGFNNKSQEIKEIRLISAVNLIKS